MKILAVIPARSGSVRIPHKNRQPLGRTTLVEEAVLHAVSSRLITDIAISSDDPDYDVLPSLASFVDRPPKLSTGYRDSLRMVTRHAMLDMEHRRDTHYDLVVTLQPATPLRTGALIDAMIEGMLDRNCNGALTGVPIVPWCWSAQGAAARNSWFPAPYPLSQDLPGFNWQEINTVQIARHDVALFGERWDLPLYLQPLPTWAALDIDTPDDLAHAQRTYPHLLSLLRTEPIPQGHVLTSINGITAVPRKPLKP